jgi:hypothetical protein
MTLTTMTGAGLALGLVGLALGLYLLQRIRVRHEEFLVVTTLFWREAQEESHARTLVERFRHPLVYAFALLVAGLLWLAAAGPDSRRDRGTQHVLLLDGSAGMALPGRFDAAVDALERELEASPRDRTEVLWCGADVHTLLASGEDRALLRARLVGRWPEAAPASVERALLERASAERIPGSGVTRDAQHDLRCVVFGDAPVRAWALESARASHNALSTDAGRAGDTSSAQLLLERAQLEPETSARAAVSSARIAALGRGITALGVAPAASGAWTAVDVYVAVRGAGADSAELRATLDGAPLAGAERTVLGPEHAELLLRDVPAMGATFEVRLAEADPISFDDVARVVLPSRPRIRVVLGADVASELGADAAGALRAALEVDTAVELVTDAANADVFVGAAPDPARPSLAFVPAEGQVEAVLVGHAEGLDSYGVLAAALGELGLDRLDAATLAAELGRELAVGAAPLQSVDGTGAQRRVTLWRELVAGSAPSFLEDRAFPLVIGRAVRWLAAAPSVTPYVAVGRTLPRRVGAPSLALAAEVVPLGRADASLLDAARYVLATVSTTAATVPTAADGVDVSQSLAALTTGTPEGPGGWRPLTWILLVAAALVCAEWALVQRGRMP